MAVWRRLPGWAPVAVLGLVAAGLLFLSPAARAEAPPKHQGAPKITGSPVDGRLLTVGEGRWKSTTKPTVSYQWVYCLPRHGACTPIPGAESSTYRATTTQIGGKLRAIVTATTPGGSTSVRSHASKKILAGSPIEIEPPKVEGDLKEGAKLVANPGTWGGTPPLSYEYQWERCSHLTSACEAIPGATAAAYTLELADVTDSMIVKVTATNSLGTASASSAETPVVGALLPVNLELPSVLGNLLDGQLLSALPGSWSGTEPITYTYQWLVCDVAGEKCAEISKATEPVLKLVSGLIGDTVEVVVTATNGAGSTSATSSPTSVVEGLLPSLTKAPEILGSLVDGQLLSATSGSWSGSEPISYAYKWLECDAAGEKCEEISKATGPTLQLVTGLIGDTVKVVVTATNVAGSTSETSAATSVIQGLLPSIGKGPEILGSLVDGQLLSATTGSWSGSEPITYAYQWLQCNAAGEKCAEISKATGSTLQLLSGLVGDTVKVVVTATNVAGSSSQTSAATSVIQGLLPSNSKAPEILGSLVEGQVLSASSGTWSGSEPISYAYQWLQCNAAGEKCTEISKASASTLSLVSGLIGDTVKVVVTATNVAGSRSETSAASGVVAGILPSIKGLPSIAGSLVEGQTLTANPGSWTGTEPISYAYQWLQCNAAGEKCTEISKASASTLSLVTGLIGDTVKVVVTATNVAGSRSETSAATGVIEGILPSNKAAPSIAGTLVEGQTLTASPGSWTGTEPITYGYQWLQCNGAGEKCTEISKSTASTLKLVTGLIGDTVKVVVTATNVAGSRSETSAASGTIAGILPDNEALPSITGSLLSGQLLTAHPGTWSGTEPITYGYQWQLCSAVGKSCSNIAEGTSSTFKLVGLDVGLTLDVVVTAKNLAGSTVATSPVTGLIGL